MFVFKKKVQKLFVFQLFLSYVKFHCTVFTRDAESGVLPLSFCFCVNDVLILRGCGTSELNYSMLYGLVCCYRLLVTWMSFQAQLVS